MSILPDIEVRFFARATGLRLAVNPDTLLDGLSWEIVEAGGLSQMSVPLAGLFDDAFPVAAGDIAEVWLLGTGETVPRARAIVGQPEAVLSLKEQRTLTAYGRMEDMNKAVLDRIILIPGSADLKDFAGQIADDYQARRPGLVFVRDIQATGINLEQLSMANTTARAAMDQLYAQAGNNVTWGWDIDPGTGLDRFYLRPKTTAVGSQFFVGANVQTISNPAELQGLVNGLKLQGGPAKYSQLLTNPSFEVPSLPDEATGSLLINGGFELAVPGQPDPVGGNTSILGWNSVGGASHNQHDPKTNHNATAHTGDWYAILDQAGKELWQEAPVSPGKTYQASLYCARERGTFAAQGTLIIEGRAGAGGAVLESYSLPLAPGSTAWTGGQGTTTLSSDGLSLSTVFQNAATTTARVRIVAGFNGQGIGGGQQGLLVDDVTFADVTAVGATGWSTHLQNPTSGNNKFLSTDWGCRAAAWEGCYGLRVNVVADGSDKPAIAPFPGDLTSGQGYHFKPAPQQNIRVGYRVRMAPGLATGPGQVACEYREWASDGHETQHIFGPTVTVPSDGQWHTNYLDVSAHGDAATATMQATIAASGWYDFDGFTARDKQAGEFADPADPLGTLTYLRGTDYEIYVTAEQVCPAGSDAASSFGTYGRMEDVVSNKDIVNWNTDAKQWFIAYFTRQAVLLRRPQVQITGEMSQVPTPASGLQVQVSGLASADIEDWCAKASYSWARATMAIKLALSSERPTFAKLLNNISAGGGGGSASSIAAVSKGAANGGNTTTPAAPVLASSTTSGTVKTDVNQADPLVYTKATVDTLLAALQSALAAVSAKAVPASWTLAGMDSSAGGASAFNPGDISPTWDMDWPTPNGDLSFSTADGVFTPIAYEQHVVLATRLKVATAKTIQITVTADNAARVLLGGTQIGADANIASGAVTYSLPLTVGWNVLQICFQNGQGDSYGLSVQGAPSPLATLVDRMAPG